MSTFLVRVFLAFLGGLILVFIVHNSLKQNTSFSLARVYVFHAIASVALCVILVQARASLTLKDQVGFIYLISVAVKAIAFFVIFRKTIFSSHSFSNQEALAMLTPLFLGLFFEVFFVSKLLQKTPKIKNE